MVDERTHHSPKPGNTEKDPGDRATGDEAQGSQRIEELQAVTSPGFDSAAGEEDPGAALGDDATRDAVSAEAAAAQQASGPHDTPIQGVPPMMTHIDRLIDALNDLIETSKDGEYGFRACAEEVESDAAKQLFASRAEQCRQAEWRAPEGWPRVA